ncbi:hypothetical protein [Cohnella hashimotonis]|uniref:Uncharacterized protein n=1 Tax=Cohnella hashimotonis TaxID=2826895 RepID=A0ABT6TS49_9BACL|nr:hypothetical protein [Cohnella hashimotonis]MDI4649672.1 hypothetical protein [Cohnella hashimotonis]
MIAKRDNGSFYVENQVIKHFVLSLVSSIICSTVLTLAEEDRDILALIVYCIYTFPSILIMGGLFSFVIERVVLHLSLKNRLMKYLFKVILYLIAGFLFITLYFLIVLRTLPYFNPWSAFISFYQYGFWGALLYLHLHLLYEFIVFDRKRPEARCRELHKGTR